MPYITYLKDPEKHTNTYATHAGWGRTKAESQSCSLYYANQLPWVVTVPASQAPAWAKRQAWTPRRYELWVRTLTGGKLSKSESRELEAMEVA